MNQPTSPSNDFLKRNEKLWLRPGRIYIPAWQFSGLEYEATTAADIKSGGTGTPSDVNMNITEVNTSGITGINFTTVDNSINHLMEFPCDMDMTYPLYASVYWTANNTSGSTEWVLFYKTYQAGSTALGSAEAASTFSKVIGAQTMAGVAYTLMRTPEARLNGGAFADNKELLQIKVQMHALVTITTTIFIGLALRYTRKMLQYGSMRTEAKPATYFLSDKYAD
jgi:hypothetical protein